MNESTQTAILVLTIVAAVTSTATLSAGIVVGIKVRRKFETLENELKTSRTSAKKLVQDLADRL